jgi:hypothetical protein
MTAGHSASVGIYNQITDMIPFAHHRLPWRLKRLSASAWIFLPIAMLHRIIEASCSGWAIIALWIDKGRENMKWPPISRNFKPLL